MKDEALIGYKVEKAGEQPVEKQRQVRSLYPGENMVGRDTCTPMAIAALLTIART